MSTPKFMEDPDCSKPGHEVAFNVPPRMEYRGQYFRAEIVHKDTDLIYQFFQVRHPDFRSLLAEIIESHFGNTNAFSAATVPELKSLGVRARGVTDHTFFSLDHYTSDFLGLVDSCLGEL